MLFSISKAKKNGHERKEPREVLTTEKQEGRV